MLALDAHCVNGVFSYLCVNDGICLALTCKRMLRGADAFIARVKAMTPKQLARDDASIMFRKCSRNARAAYTASKYNSAHMLRKFMALSYSDEEILCGACRRGDVAMIDTVVHERHVFVDGRAMYCAGKCGNTEVVRHICRVAAKDWVALQRLDGSSVESSMCRQCLIGATVIGDIKMMQFLMARGYGTPFPRFSAEQKPKYEHAHILAELNEHTTHYVHCEYSTYGDIYIDTFAKKADVIAAACCGLVEARRLDVVNELLPQITDVTRLFIDACRAGWEEGAYLLANDARIDHARVLRSVYMHDYITRLMQAWGDWRACFDVAIESNDAALFALASSCAGVDWDYVLDCAVRHRH